MPVILPEQHHAAWLGETDDGNLKALLLPYPADQMRMWEISPRVNSPKSDDPSFWEPIRPGPAQPTTDALELVHEDTLSDREA
jgi:putative SOS response-associated peptidase YedK